MSLFVLTPETVLNKGTLKFSTAPRKILTRGAIWPKGDFTWGLLFRLIFEMQVLRFIVALLPFLVAMVVMPDMALPISQAPLFMLIVISFVELRILRLSPKARERVASEAEVARALDSLNFRGRRILSQIAAHRRQEAGTLYLVVEQSEMARVPPLTLVSLQADSGKQRLVPLSKEERDIIRDGLFDADFTEGDLLKANLRENVPMRSVSFDTRGVSSHARLAAYLDQSPSEGIAEA